MVYKKLLLKKTFNNMTPKEREECQETEANGENEMAQEIFKR